MDLEARPARLPLVFEVAESATDRAGVQAQHSDQLGLSRPDVDAPSWIRTSGLLLRRESLYPAELSGPMP